MEHPDWSVPEWCDRDKDVTNQCDHQCLECLKAKTEVYVEGIAIQVALKEPVAALIKAMIDDEFPEDERHA